jgi:8-oxo-dGTP diphosphatase
MPKKPNFNIRVYAIITNNSGDVLISHEHMLGTFMTKFPGGGLEFGEGTIDCLKREAIEEFGQEIEVLEHFYTTDYYQPALYYTNTQLISIYYRAKLSKPDELAVTDGPLPADAPQGAIAFQWVNPVDLDNGQMTFPIDRIVMKKLSEMAPKRDG